MTRTLAVYGALALSFLVAGCGGNSADDEGAATDESAATTTAAAPAATTAAPATTAAAAPTADSADTLDGAKLADLKGDEAHGKVVFLQCQTCHSIDAGKNMIGPSLHGIIGRKASTITGFQYSQANHNSGITWTPEKLFQYLEKPQRVVPGTKMAFAGLSKAQDRADVIAYLTTASK